MKILAILTIVSSCLALINPIRAIAATSRLICNALEHFGLITTESIQIGMMMLPIFAIVTGLIKSIQYLRGMKIRSGWISVLAAFIAAVYLVPCIFSVILIPSEVMRFGPLAVSIAFSLWILVLLLAINRQTEQAMDGNPH